MFEQLRALSMTIAFVIYSESWQFLGLEESKAGDLRGYCCSGSYLISVLPSLSTFLFPYTPTRVVKDILGPLPPSGRYYLEAPFFYFIWCPIHFTAFLDCSLRITDTPAASRVEFMLLHWCFKLLLSLLLNIWGSKKVIINSVPFLVDSRKLSKLRRNSWS